MIILGIDPGTATTGYGAIKKTGNSLVYLGCGVISTTTRYSDSERLQQLHNQLSKIIKEYSPDILAVERLYFFRNFKTVIGVAQARGVIMLAAAKNNVPIAEYTPLEAKLVVAGYGRAEKPEVQKKVKSILKLGLRLKEFSHISKPFRNDAVDALALAICCARKK